MIRYKFVLDAGTSVISSMRLLKCIYLNLLVPVIGVIFLMIELWEFKLIVFSKIREKYPNSGYATSSQQYAGSMAPTFLKLPCAQIPQRSPTLLFSSEIECGLIPVLSSDQSRYALLQRLARRLQQNTYHCALAQRSGEYMLMQISYLGVTKMRRLKLRSSQNWWPSLQYYNSQIWRSEWRFRCS